MKKFYHLQPEIERALWPATRALKRRGEDIAELVRIFAMFMFLYVFF